jgi:NAD-dependent deacetylase
VSASTVDLAFITRAAEWIAGARSVVVSTGAGMSKESGIPTFRDALEGLWARYDPTELATEAGFRKDPRRVWSWYAYRRRMIERCRPNAGHLALAELESLVPSLLVVTQNIDGLHTAAGSTDVVELHGNIHRVKCLDHGHPFAGPTRSAASASGSSNGGGSTEAESGRSSADDSRAGRSSSDDRATGDASPDRHASNAASADGRTEHALADPVDEVEEDPPACPVCGSPLRPDVVWFGEMLPEAAVERAWAAAGACDVMLVVGTSGTVWPAAELPVVARRGGARVIEVNPEPSDLTTSAVDLFVQGPAGGVLPALVARVRELADVPRPRGD